ncbi:uncharacterized protein LOC134230682 [Saccostrea cucullata]|uniref:uncharacterized protein LOC134230682 n=1 Tax=Saccostrea cuccullata TaxID=36930 RepID=UPI002ED0E8FB
MYTTVNGLTLFNTGCRNPSFCNSTSLAEDPEDPNLRVFHPHITECKECCNKSVCNNDGCGSKGYPVNRGPLCFTCPQTTDPALCETIDVCNEDEDCHVHQEMEFGDVFFSQSCQEKHGCLRQAALQIFGKRSEQECTNCCNEDQCNSELVCAAGYIGHRALDCWEIYQRGVRTSGVYMIYPWNDRRSIKVLCDMDLFPGG